MNRKSKLNVATLEAADNLFLTKMLRDALKVEFALTQEQHEALEAFYAPQLVSCGTQRACDHPLAAAHLRFATKFARDFASQHPNIIEIGPNAVNFAQLAWGNPLAHGCTMFSARDQGRHINAAMSATLRGLRPNATTINKIQVNGLSQKLYHDRVQALASGIPSHTFCVQGFGQCSFQSPVAISVHSLYDITIGEVALGMLNHSCMRIKAWMHFPIQALEVDNYTDHENMYRFKTRRSNGKNIIDFNFLGDTSFGYQHEKENWLSWLQIGGIDTPFGFSLVIEKVKRNGSQFELDIHRTTASGTFFYQIPNTMVNLVKVPNLREVAAKGFCTRQTIPYIITDAEKVRKLFRFIYSRSEKGYSLETVKGYARTLVSEVRLGDRVAEHRWDLTFEEFADVCVSVYILATHRRQIDNRVLEKSLNHLSKIESGRGFWDKLFECMHDAMWSMLEGSGLLYHRDLVNITGHGTDKFLDKQGRNLFKRMFIDFYQDHDCYSEVTAHPISFQVNFKFAPVPTVPLLGGPPPPPIPRLTADLQVIPPPVSMTTGWAADIGIRCVFPETLSEDYVNEEHHSKLVQDYAISTRKAQAENKEALFRVLSKALEAIDHLKKIWDESNGQGRHMTHKPNPARRNPDDVHVSLCHENIAIVMGVPGSRKTTRVCSEVVSAHTSDNTDAKILYIVPTRELRETYEKTVTLPHRVLTPHKALAQILAIEPTLVIIDEAFTFPAAYINLIATRYHVVCVGDPGQITRCDFNNMWQNAMKFEKIQPFLPTMTLLTTYRCPQDVVTLPILRAMYPGISSVSAIVSSIKHVHANYTNPNSQTLTFVQTEKICQQQHAATNAGTVHEKQGATFKSVILHYAGTKAERDLLTASPNHLVVGLTRHTHELFIRDLTAVNGETGELVKFINDSMPLSCYANNANIDLQAVDAGNNAKQVVVEEDVHEDHAEYPPCAADESSTEQVLVKLYGSNIGEEHQHVMTTEIPMHGDAKGRIRLENLGKDEAFEQKKHTVHRFVASQRVKVTKPSDQRMLAKTMMDRLTVKTKSLPTAKATTLAARLATQVKDEFDWHISDTVLHQCFIEAAEKFQERGHDLSELHEIENWKDMNVHQVKSFLKTQQKPSLAKDPLQTDKSGQSISAWEKTLNFQVNIWARVLEFIITKQSKGRVIVATGMTDKEMMSLLEANHLPTDKKLENDHTMFDSTQNEVAIMLNNLLLEEIGRVNTFRVPEYVLQCLMEQQEERQISSDVMSLMVHLKLDSGQPFTLIRNCNWNMAITLDTVKDARVFFIKGDDSICFGHDVAYDYEAMKTYTNEIGCQFKPIESISGEFVGFIINKYGASYDLGKIASKVLTRNYKDKKDFDEYRTAIGVVLRDIPASAAHNMILVNSYHHTKSLDATADFDLLMSFLINFAHGRIPFSSTVEYESRNYITDCAAHLSDHHAIDASKNKAIPVVKYSKKTKLWGFSSSSR
nr:MAG: replicase [Beijing sediment hepe-like virus 3]